jgi:four helix bundle protein
MMDREKFKTEFKRRLYAISLAVIQFVETLPRDGVSRIIGDQLLRSGTSIGANYIESLSSCSKKEFLHYFQISLRSANESKYWLSLLRDSAKGNQDKIVELLKEISEISKIFAAGIMTMKNKKTIR